MRLFIAEKPSLAAAIAGGLGNPSKKDGYFEVGDDCVTWCFGHILEQLKPNDYDEKYKNWNLADLPIVPSTWKLRVRNEGGVKKQFKTIKDLLGKADEIVNGGDPDREGQLLVDEVIEYVGCNKPVKRILLNALDDVSVKKAIGDLRDNKDFIGLKNSALGRSRADWLVGMNLSRAYSIKAQEAGFDRISIGRVQTPTMALVVRREDEIKHFVPKKYFPLTITWQHPNGQYTSRWQPKEDLDGLDENGRVLDRKIVDEVLTKVKATAQFGSGGSIASIEQKAGKTEQHKPYSLSSLQIEAGRKYGLSPQQILDAMQGLYEKKITTYPRSDCEYLPTSQLAEAGEVISHLDNIPELAPFVKQADLSIKSKAWDDSKITAHHALVPTREGVDINSLTENERKLYIMVAKAFLAQFFPVHTFKTTKVTTVCAEETFIANGREIVEMGWKALYASEPDKEKENDEDENANQSIPKMNEGDAVKIVDGKVSEKETKPPARFTPSTLLAAMKNIYKYVKDESLKDALKECSGIGTEATRAGIIEHLQEMGFLKLEKKKLVPMEKAVAICAALGDELLYPDTTALWEKDLEEVSDNKKSLTEFADDCLKFVNQMIASAKEAKFNAAANVYKCPKCGKALRQRKGPKGNFWGCTGYPGCSVTFPDKKGKPDFEAKKSGGTGVTTEEKCAICGSDKLKQVKTKKGTTAWVCEDCKTWFDDKKNKPDFGAGKCPTCGKGILKKKSGQKGFFWACSNFKECKQTYPDKNGKPQM